MCVFSPVNHPLSFFLNIFLQSVSEACAGVREWAFCTSTCGGDAARRLYTTAKVLFTSVPSLREEPPLNETDIKERERQEEAGAARLRACVCH